MGITRPASPSLSPWRVSKPPAPALISEPVIESREWGSGGSSGRWNGGGGGRRRERGCGGRRGGALQRRGPRSGWRGEPEPRAETGGGCIQTPFPRQVCRAETLHGERGRMPCSVVSGAPGGPGSTGEEGHSVHAWTTATPGAQVQAGRACPGGGGGSCLNRHTTRLYTAGGMGGGRTGCLPSLLPRSASLFIPRDRLASWERKAKPSPVAEHRGRQIKSFLFAMRHLSSRD